MDERRGSVTARTPSAAPHRLGRERFSTVVHTGPLPPDLPRRVKAGVLAECIGVSVVTIRQWSRDGVIPPPLRVTARTHLYDTEGVREALRRLAEGGGA